MWSTATPSQTFSTSGLLMFDYVYICRPLPKGGLLPELYCEVRERLIDGSFTFSVINGAWPGKFNGGDLYCVDELVGSGYIALPVPADIQARAGWSNDYAYALEIGRELLMPKSAIQRLKLRTYTLTLLGFFPRLYGALRASIRAFRFAYNHPETVKKQNPPNPTDFQDTDIPF